jgi:Protein of unknown function (DUF2914)
MRIALVCLALIFVAATFASAEPPSATAVVCTAIVKNSCEGANVKFPANVGKVYGFSEAINVPKELVHVWFYKGHELGRVEMRAPSASRWLTWSNVTVAKTMVGPWRLEARDADGTLLAAFNFTVE